MASKSKKPAEPDDFADFEKSLEELQTIVESMEDEKLPLNELISRFELGGKLLKTCETTLNQARERVKLITLQNQDQTNHPSQPSPQQPSEDTDDDNDIRLL